ncbi:hypothetical protein ACM5Q9_12210 [Advenella sp. RU8]|uniref:hypothetical protein n=1 Tax=Advenella sp. RU8 TaxID=3399575 RepID=UPI003AADC336
MCDSYADAQDRKNGICPMSAEYIEKVNEKRKQQGFQPLDSVGMAVSDETMQACQQEARDELNKRRTRVDEILFYKWDPIGLSGSNGPRDEYSAYVAGIIERVCKRASPEALAKHLTYLSAEVIGIGVDEERDKSVAELIYAVVLGMEYYPDYEVIAID